MGKSRKKPKTSKVTCEQIRRTQVISEYALPESGAAKRFKKSEVNKDSFSSGIETDRNLSKTKSSSRGKHPNEHSDRNTSKTKGFDEQESDLTIAEELRKRLRFPKPFILKGVKQERLDTNESKKRSKKDKKAGLPKSSRKEEKSGSKKSKSRERKSSPKQKPAAKTPTAGGHTAKPDKRGHPGLRASRKSAPNAQLAGLVRDSQKSSGLSHLKRFLRVENHPEKHLFLKSSLSRKQDPAEKPPPNFGKKSKNSFVTAHRASGGLASRSASKNPAKSKRDSVAGSRTSSRDCKQKKPSRPGSKNKKRESVSIPEGEDPLGSYFGEKPQRKSSKKQLSNSKPRRQGQQMPENTIASKNGSSP